MTLTRIKIIIILFFVWILAIVLPTVRFSPGNWTLVQMDRIEEHVPPGTEVFFVILAIGLIVGLAGLAILAVISIWRQPRRKKDDSFFWYRENPPITWLERIIIVLLFVALAGLIWLFLRNAPVLEDLMGLRSSLQTISIQGQRPAAPQSFTSETRRPEIHPVSFPKWRIPLIFALLIALGLSLRHILRSKPLKEEPEVPQVIRMVTNAMKELERGGDLSDVVLRCYRDMCKILGRKVAVSRDLTAREFAKLLLQASVQEQEVARLTDLFERVRYGRHPTGPNEQAEALALLKTIEEKYGRLLIET